METDHISRLLARDPLMCYYEVVAKDTLPEVVSTYPSAFVCNTHDSDQPGEHWVAMYVDEIGDYFDPYGQKPQHAEFTNFMNKHCSQWSPNDHILQSPISTVCGQYCVAFLMFRCRNISMHAFARLFTSDLIANDCRVFDWLGALNKKWWKTSVFVSYVLTMSTTAIDSHFMSSSQTYRRQFWRNNPVHTVQLITESIQRIP